MGALVKKTGRVLLVAMILFGLAVMFAPRVRDIMAIASASDADKPAPNVPKALMHSVYEHNDPEGGYEIIEVGRCKKCGRFVEAGLTLCPTHEDVKS